MQHRLNVENLRNSRKSHVYNPSIFRAYDIRGEYNETLFEADAYALGRGFGQFLWKYHKASEKVRPEAVVGRDGRLSSPRLAAVFIEGLISAGVGVLDIGLCPTPVLYFTCATSYISHGVMVTGSHNPASHNGFKFVYNKKPLCGEDLRSLFCHAIEAEQAANDAEVLERDKNEDYLQFLSEQFKHLKPKRIAWDASNGAVAEILSTLTKIIPGKHFCVNAVVDGTFPNHSPDPTLDRNLTQLRRCIESNQCDLGFAFDGDGDRVVCVDRYGRALSGDQLLYFFAKDYIRDYPGEKIVVDVKTSQWIVDSINAEGGEAVMWKTGHSLMKRKMHEVNSKISGEYSGHMFFADKYFGYDDGPYTAMRLLENLELRNSELDYFVDTLPSIFGTPELKFTIPKDANPQDIMAQMRTYLLGQGVPFLDIDGLRVQSQDGWWLLRPSNTSPYIVARCEAGSKKLLELVLQEMRGIAHQYGLKEPLTAI